MVYYDEIKKSLRYNNAVNGGSGMEKAVFIKACWIFAQAIAGLADALIWAWAGRHISQNEKEEEYQNVRH